MKKAAVLLLFLLPIIFVACGGVSATQVERELYSKIDKGDVAGALALIADDAVFEVLGCPQGGCKGKEAIKGVLEGIAAQHPTHTIKSSKDSKNTATTQVEVVVDFAKAAGVQRIVANVKLELKGDKISYSQAQFDTNDQQTATAANYLRLSGIHRQAVEAVNREDLAGIIGLFTDDAVFVGGPLCQTADPCMGKAAIEKGLSPAVASHLRINVTELQVSGNSLATREEHRSDATRAAGVERSISKATVTFTGDKVSRVVVESDTSDPQTATAANFGKLSSLLRQHYEAVNKGDVAAAVAFFTDDAEMVRTAFCPAAKPCVGKAEIQKQVDSEVRDQIRYTLTNIQVSGDTVTARAERRGKSEQNAGVERSIQTDTVTFSSDKISRSRTERDLSDSQTATLSNFGRIAGLNRRREDAIQRGDVAAVMASFTDDAVFEGFGLCAKAQCAGKAAIQKEMERQVADKTKFGEVPGTARVSGNILTGKREIRSDLIQAAGVERVLVSLTYEVPKDKITSLRYALDATDPQTATYLKAGILRQLYDVGNRGDVAVTAAFFTADATLLRGGCNPQAPCVGTAAIQRQLEREPTLQFRYSVINVQVSGDSATGRVEFRNINIKNAGQERVIENVTVTFKGDKISRLVHALDLSDSQTAAFANFRRMATINSRYTDALSIGNVAGTMAALTEDAVVEGYGLCASVPCAGKAAVQKEVERQVADKTKIATVGGTARVTGDTWTGRVEVRSDSIRAAGVERIIAAATVEAKGDKVSLVRWVPDTTDPQTATYLKGQVK